MLSSKIKNFSIKEWEFDVSVWQLNFPVSSPGLKFIWNYCNSLLGCISTWICSWVHWSRLTDFTLDMCTPRFLWIPAHRMQMNTPMFQEAHRGPVKVRNRTGRYKLKQNSRPKLKYLDYQTFLLQCERTVTTITSLLVLSIPLWSAFLLLFLIFLTMPYSGF